MAYQLFIDKLEDWSKKYQGPRFHAVLCDPPYGISFMGKDWDVVSAKEWGEALLPHLYPGAIVLMFGGTRTWHKLATGMEDAGFEMWDTLMWLYGQGFPKAQSLAKLIEKKIGAPERPVVATTPSGGYKRMMVTNAEQGFRPADYYTEGNKFRSEVPTSDESAPWSGHKTCALKPAWEPILAFRVPAKETYATLALSHGSGALNIDGTRIAGPSGSGHWTTDRVSDSGRFGRYESTGEDNGSLNPAGGRYPANLLLECICGKTETVAIKQNGAIPKGRVIDSKTCYGDYAKSDPWVPYPGVAEAHTNPDCPAAQLDAQSGHSVTKRIEKPSDCGGKTWPGTFQTNRGARGHSDAGGASRFFYCAKATTAERNAGLGDEFEDKERRTLGGGLTGISGDRSGAGGESKPLEMGAAMVKNNHPTVKPIALIEYLATLLLPPAAVSRRRLLVPFAGSGSEMIGALKAGWDVVEGIEQNEEYAKIAEARLAHATAA